MMSRLPFVGYYMSVPCYRPQARELANAPTLTFILVWV